MRDDQFAALALLLAVNTLVLVIGFDALLQRARPRVIYVHDGGRDQPQPQPERSEANG